MLPFSRMKHISFEVEDIDKATALYARIFGVPGSGTHTISLDGGKGLVKTAFFHLETGSIELTDHHLLPESWEDSPLRTGPGFHHIGFEVVDFDEALSSLAEQGILPLPRFPFQTPHGRVAFFPPEETGGILMELCERAEP